jgi:small subunit ribosomal protein S8
MDTIGDLLTRIRNAAMAGKGTVEAPWSGAAEAMCRILVKEGYLKSATEKKDGQKRRLVLATAFLADDQPVINHIKRISKPGRRVYQTSKKLRRVLGGQGLMIVSTPKGMMTDADARKAGVGGEILCEVW